MEESVRFEICVNLDHVLGLGMVTVTVDVPRHICQDCVVVRRRLSHTRQHWVFFPDSCLIVNKVRTVGPWQRYTLYWFFTADFGCILVIHRWVCLHCEGISKTAAFFVSERISELYNLGKAITPNRYSILVCRESGELCRKK